MALFDRRTAHPIPVVLASQSPRRRELLRLVGISHTVAPADIDESAHEGETPVPHCVRLAEEKAAVIAARFPDALVIAADTIVVVDAEILGKPADARHAEAMLSRLAGRAHIVHTGVAVVWHGSARSGVETVEVRMRASTAAERALYIATGEPMDKAGAYGIQGYGAALIDGVTGDFFAVMGLPLAHLLRLTDALGVRYAFGAASIG